MKKILILAGSALLIIATVLIIVFTVNKPDTGLAVNPNLTDAVVGNGGITVQKGDYLYFVNGYYSKTNVTGGNNGFGDTEYGAIYRTKLTNNAISYDQDGFLTDIDIVVPKLVGYEQSNFYIYGNYIYYSSPNNNQDREGNYLSNLTDFYRININGTDNQKIYTSTAENITPEDWSIYVVGQTHYFVIKDETNLLIANTTGKLSDPETVATDVTSVAYVNYENFYNNNRDEENYYNNYIYYTRESGSTNPSITGNVLARVKLGTESEQVMFSAGTITYTLTAVANNTLYYTKSSSTMPIADLLFINHIQSNGSISSTTSDIQLTFTTYTSIYVVNNHTTLGNQVIAYDGSALYLVQEGQAPKLILNKAIEILEVYEDTVIYFDSSNSIFGKVNALATTPEETVLPQDEKTLKTDNNYFADYDGTNVFIYAAYTSAETSEQNYYLNRINLATETPATQFIGKMQTSHLPEQPDNTDATEEDYELWIK